MLPKPPRPILLLLLLPILTAVLLERLAPSSRTPPTDPPIDPPPATNLPTCPDWSPLSAPPFCRHLLTHPAPYCNCRRDRHTQRCDDRTLTFPSQYSQDYYLYTRHFIHLPRRGIYLDIAACDAKEISNTYFFDACLGWDGVCVEPNDEYFQGIKRYRSCRLVERCVSDIKRNVTFILGGGYSGVEQTNKNIDTFLLEARTGEVAMECIPTQSVLDDAGVDVVDYLSLDVEGHELHVLQGVDWDRVRVNVMTIETSPDTLPGIEEFLVKNGYVRHRPWFGVRSLWSGLLTEDAVFLHSGVVFGKPE